MQRRARACCVVSVQQGPEPDRLQEETMRTGWLARRAQAPVVTHITRENIHLHILQHKAFHVDTEFMNHILIYSQGLLNTL